MPELPHGDADVGASQRRCVVDAVTGHRDHLAQSVQCVGDAKLRFRRVASEDDLVVFGEDTVEFGLAHRIEFDPGDHEVRVDADPPRDRLRGEAVVAGHDHDSDAGLGGSARRRRRPRAAARRAG